MFNFYNTVINLKTSPYYLKLYHFSFRNSHMADRWM
jgi:hypothetical protein